MMKLVKIPAIIICECITVNVMCNDLTIIITIITVSLCCETTINFMGTGSAKKSCLDESVPECEGKRIMWIKLCTHE